MSDLGTPCTERTPRVVAARKLLRRSGRERAGRFIAEGAQAVAAALASIGGERPTQVFELFVGAAAARRNPDLVAQARVAGVVVSSITDRAVSTLSETVTPQGLVAVCGLLDVPLATALAGSPRLVVVLVDMADPGNAGTVIRVADAAGADAVVLAGDCVDPHNGKCVRGSAGSLFHLPLVMERDVDAVLAAARGVGLRLLATTAAGELDLHAPDAEQTLADPCAWLLGSEAHGLPAPVLAAADARVRVPIYGRAESLNLATAASICVYATTRVQRAARISAQLLPALRPGPS
jgi:TrmH family RNA methyltransferase